MGPFYLTKLLLPNIKKASPPARIVSVSSNGHFLGFISSRFLRFKAHFESDAMTGLEYGNTKLANILFSKELQRQLVKEKRNDILSVSVHPGAVYTNFGASSSVPVVLKYVRKTPAQGARTQVYTSLAPAKELTPGGYYMDWLQHSGRKPIALSPKKWEIKKSE